jgi:mannosyl-3-phosphoglycerate phosphatase
MKNLIIFTDLDETLLERRTYSFQQAEPALALLREKGIPLVICSSKTMPEIERYCDQLDNHHPFVSENGGGIFIPDGYFKDYLNYTPESHGIYDEITLGTPYDELRGALSELKAEGFNVRGFGDMDAGEVSSLTGLGPEEAELSLRRDFDEPFTYDGDIDALRDSIRRKGLQLTEGRFFHLIGGYDKGKAVEVLKNLYRAALGEITTAALGDSPTDIPMLGCVDYPIVVRKDDGSYDSRVEVPGLIRAEGIGPAGWNSAVMELVKKF